MWKFVKKHKGKIALVGIVTSGIYLAHKLAEKKYLEWQEAETKKLLDKVRRQHHFESTQKAGDVTLKTALFPYLRQIINGEILNSSMLVSQIKSTNDKELKVKLWDDLKLMVFDRCSLLVVAGTLLNVILRVQLNIVAGYVYQQTVVKVQQNNNKKFQLNGHLQEKYLSLGQKFVKKGIGSICKDLNLPEIVGDLSLKQKLSLSDLDGLFGQIEMVISDKYGGKNADILQCLQEDFDWSDLNGEEQRVFKLLLADTLEVLDSPDVPQVIRECCHQGFNVLIDQVAEFYSNFEQQEQFTHPGQLEGVHVAKLVPFLDALVGREEGQLDPLMTLMCSNVSLQKFSANVYESFCQDK